MSQDDDRRGFVSAELLQNLKELRQGRGWDVDDARLGIVPERVRRYLRVDTAAPQAEQLQHLAQLIAYAIEQLTVGDQLWIKWAYNLDPRQEADWSKRIEAMVGDEEIDERTVRRRVDKALVRLRDGLLQSAESARRTGPRPVLQRPPALSELHELLALRAAFQVSSLDVSIYVYRDRVVVRETREVHAREDGVQDTLVSRVLFRRGTRVETEVTEAAHLEHSTWPTEKWMLHVIRFPRPMSQGQTRRYVVTHTAYGMAPLFVSSAQKETERLVVRLQFRDVRPATVWRIEGLPPAVLQAEDDLLPTVDRHAERVQPDPYGYYEHDFQQVDDFLEGLAWDVDGAVARPEGSQPKVI